MVFRQALIFHHWHLLAQCLLPRATGHSNRSEQKRYMPELPHPRVQCLLTMQALTAGRQFHLISTISLSLSLKECLHILLQGTMLDPQISTSVFILPLGSYTLKKLCFGNSTACLLHIHEGRRLQTTQVYQRNTWSQTISSTDPQDIWFHNLFLAKFSNKAMSSSLRLP